MIHLKSAVRRDSIIRCVGWPVASSSQFHPGHPYGLFRIGLVKNGLSKQSRILECDLEKDVRREILEENQERAEGKDRSLGGWVKLELAQLCGADCQICGPIANRPDT